MIYGWRAAATASDTSGYWSPLLIGEINVQLNNSASGYGTVSRTLHWTTVVLVIVLLITGKFGDMEDAAATNTFLWHSSLGVAVFVLAVISIVWNVLSRPPPLPAGMSRFSRTAARIVHVCLYALLLALPLSGWLATSAEGRSVNLFGGISLPRWEIGAPTAPAARAESQLSVSSTGESEGGAEDVHEILANVLLALATLHVLAALKHQFWDRDDTLSRMFPAFRIRRSGESATARVRDLPGR